MKKLPLETLDVLRHTENLERFPYPSRDARYLHKNNCGDSFETDCKYDCNGTKGFAEARQIWQYEKVIDRGYFFRRTKTKYQEREWLGDVSGKFCNPREIAFQKNWAEECKLNVGLSFGYGTVQNIFMKQRNNTMRPSRCLEILTFRDRKIVATVIQWLGSNCGLEFLIRTLRDCGYRLEKIEEQDLVETKR